MTDLNDRAITFAMDDYAHALRGARLSAALDARMESMIQAWAAESRPVSVLRRPLPWVAAAACVAVISAGIAIIVSHQGGEAAGEELQATLRQLPLVSPDSLPPIAAGQVSLYPAEAAVFRVKASLASTPVPRESSEGEKQYWVDVRIANDGTMRIMQVLPAEHGRIVPAQ